MSKSPSPKLDQLRAMREAQIAENKPAASKRKEAEAGPPPSAAKASAKTSRKKSIPIDKLNASNDD